MLRKRDEMLVQIKHHLSLAQDRMKMNAYKHRRELSFNKGDMVFLKLRQYMQQYVAKRLYQKLAVRFYGPFEVLEKVRDVAYRVLLPVDSKIHNMFHVSQLKPVIGSHHSVSPLPTSFSLGDEVVIEPESIVDTRYDVQGHLEALVSWSGIPYHENSWERVSELLQQFPRMKLEDKLQTRISH